MPDEPTPRAPFAALIGAVVEEAREGYARMAVVARREHLDVLGHVHSGVLTTMMDSVIGMALGRLRGDEDRRRRAHATIEMNTGFMARAVEGDEIVVEGRVEHMASNVGFGEAEARRRGDGSLLAKARLVYAIGRRRK